MSENQSEEAVEEVKYAGFWIRIAATMIDVIILWAFNFFILHKMLPADWGSVAQFLLNALYFAWFISSTSQGTLGKMLLKLKVTDLEGKRISFIRSLGRYMVYEACFIFLGIALGKLTIASKTNSIGLIDIILVSFSTVVAFTPVVGVLMIAYTERNQGLHDKIASTLVVVREKKLI